MNKGLKPSFEKFQGILKRRRKRNTDLMNKGLKLFLYFFCSIHFPRKRNTDLMNKGLKLEEISLK